MNFIHLSAECLIMNASLRLLIFHNLVHCLISLLINPRQLDHSNVHTRDFEFLNFHLNKINHNNYNIDKHRAFSLEVTCNFRLYLKKGRTGVKPSWKHWIFRNNYTLEYPITLSMVGTGQMKGSMLAVNLV